MITNRSEFSNRPPVISKFLPDNFDLNLLKTSGWYAPLNNLINGPDKFKLYHLFVIAPNPDLYVTQIAFGTTYKVVTPATEEGDEPIVENEIIRDRNGNIVYTDRRVAADLNNDNIPDTDQGDIYVSAGGNNYDTMRFVTNDQIDESVHPSSIFSINTSGNDLSVDVNNDNIPDFTADNIIFNVESSNYHSEDVLVKARSDGNSEVNDDIVEDPDTIVVTNRSAIFSRSFYAGTWTTWTIWTGGYAEGTASASTGGGGTTTSSDGSYIDTDLIYSYVDKRISFNSYVSGIASYGMQVEITGTYNSAPYDPHVNVYSVNALEIEYDTADEFPEIGDPKKLYVAKSENRLYRFDEGTGSYYCCGSDYNEITDLVSGNSIVDNN